MHLKIDGNGQLKNKIKNAKNSLALIMSALLLPGIYILWNNIYKISIIEIYPLKYHFESSMNDAIIDKQSSIN